MWQALIFGSLLGAALTYPQGAPESVCDLDGKPSHGKNDPQVLECPYTVQYKPFTPGVPTTLTIKVKEDDYFRGYLLTVLNSDSEPVGTFGRRQNLVCDGGAVSHAEGSRKQMAKVEWTPPADSANATYKIFLTVVRSFSKFWVNCGESNIMAEKSDLGMPVVAAPLMNQSIDRNSSDGTLPKETQPELGLDNLNDTNDFNNPSAVDDAQMNELPSSEDSADPAIPPNTDAPEMVDGLDDQEAPMTEENDWRNRVQEEDYQQEPEDQGSEYQEQGDIRGAQEKNSPEEKPLTHNSVVAPEGKDCAKNVEVILIMPDIPVAINSTNDTDYAYENEPISDDDIAGAVDDEDITTAAYAMNDPFVVSDFEQDNAYDKQEQREVPSDINYGAPEASGDAQSMHYQAAQAAALRKSFLMNNEYRTTTDNGASHALHTSAVVVLCALSFAILLD